MLGNSACLHAGFVRIWARGGLEVNQSSSTKCIAIPAIYREWQCACDRNTQALEGRIPKTGNTSDHQDENESLMRIESTAARKRSKSTSTAQQFCLVAMLALITVGLAAQTSPAASDLPSNQNVIALLTQTIDWYRRGAIERQIATDPVDLVFLEGNRESAAQILQSSFDFARADTQLSAAESNPDKGSATNSNGSPELAQFVQLEHDTELQSREAATEIDAINDKIKTAHGIERRELQAALDATQSRLEVLQEGLSTLGQLVEFTRVVASRQIGDLASTIDDLARTVPDTTNPSSDSQMQASLHPLPPRLRDSGILALSSEVSALDRKLNIIDDAIRRTESLRQASEALRNPLVAVINKRLPAVAENALEGSDLTELQRRKTRLDELGALVKALSPAIVALDKQRVLLAAYTLRLKNWRAGVLAEDKQTWRNLISRITATVLAIAALVILGTLVRRLTKHSMGDTERRHIALVLQRIFVWSTIVAVTAFAFASDLTTLATFFGLLAAGVAVALQSLILSVIGFFVLVGRRGIRIGDRVQISGITGDVTDIGWLQFQVKEIDARTQQATGNVVTFSNSIVLAAPATGLSKFIREYVKPEELEVVATASH